MGRRRKNFIKRMSKGGERKKRTNGRENGNFRINKEPL
jgi:hypothetical protein